MLIATLPTLTGIEAERLSEKILSHPLIGAVRYNTGGDSPYKPKQILDILKPMADRHGKSFYVDLEGRQVRVARWSPQSSGVAVLNRDFTIELPALIHFRRAGWFDVIGAKPEERKIFFKPRRTKDEYYLGESQSVNIVAKKFEVKRYLGGLDFEYIAVSVKLGISTFMLSFVEGFEDRVEFYKSYYRNGSNRGLLSPKLVLKIESQKGIEFVSWLPDALSEEFQLMAARDDLFLSFVNNRAEFLDAVRLIVKKDPKAILASRIMSGLESQGELTIGDLADLALMKRFGYRNFMLSDGMADCFDSAMQDWQEIMMPILKKNRFPEKKKWKKK